MNLTYQSIGVIHTPFHSKEGMPVQSKGAEGIQGSVALHEEFIPALKDLDGFSHIILVYHFHESRGYQLQTKPFLEEEIHGVFATRAPKRPNSIGISIVKLLNIDNNHLEIEGVDMLDGTPLLDIKPYVSDFDVFGNVKNGWLEKRKDDLNDVRSDDRFT